MTLLLVVLVVGLAFANSVGASRVASNARDLHWTNAALGTAALTRAALVQATTYSELESTGLATREDLDAALEEALDARDRLTELRDSGGTNTAVADLTHFLAKVGVATTALEDGDFGAAKTLLMSEMETAYVDLAESLIAEQTNIQLQIDANTAGAARMTGFIQFFLILAIPASAVLIYRTIARRQIREYRLKVEVELEAERAVGRAKDEFIAGLSHELRTPLTSIYGFAEILTDGGADDPDTSRELAQIIANESAEMTRMVDDLLAAARLESTGIGIELAPTRVSDVVSSALLPFQRAGLVVKRSREEAVVATDAARLRHVLINLISNAARHGGPNVGVEVSTGDGVVDIEVWDDGSGVPDDQLEKLFETFVHNGAATLMTGT
ncbi:MAG TPA: histidine kinase dimerization/phospho-acceptor domain-containing protein, partial [Acidimicrobiia bacterium]|nr:histidine kinase dimerization/phospho-acceptor domain-containing protein [Acidimicrobiia bacterium]